MAVQGTLNMLAPHGTSGSGHVLSCPTRSGIQDPWIPLFTGIMAGLVHGIRVYFCGLYNKDRPIYSPGGCMDLPHIGRIMVMVGAGIAFVGCIVWLAGKLGLPIGNLPGDIQIQRPGFSLNISVVTSLLLSVILTLIANLVFWFMRK